jgi:tetratricopeptide (TPR) repeat protein
VILLKQAKFGKVEQLCTEAVTIREKIHLSEHPILGHLLYVLGLSIQLSKHGESTAEQLYQKANSLLNNTFYQTTIINKLEAIGSSWRQNGEYSKAEVIYRQLVEISKTTSALEKVVPHFLHELAFTLEHSPQKNLTEVTLLYREALLLGRKTLGGKHPYVINYMHQLHNILLKCDQRVEVERLYSEILEAAKNLSVSELDVDVTVRILHNVATLSRSKADNENAELCFHELIKVAEKNSHPKLNMFKAELAKLVIQKQEKQRFLLGLACLALGLTLVTRMLWKSMG